MGKEQNIILQNPGDGVIHSAVQHPVYSNHYITDCGMVVTTSSTRHETNHTDFLILDTDEITCENCLSG